jgi:hypothetical protein
MFRRTFYHRYTKELVLYGLNGADKFKIDQDLKSKIKLRIIGGKGTDTFDLRGNIKNFVYDLSTEKNDFVKLNHTNKELSADPAILDYRSIGYEYDKTLFPQINLGYNPDDKLLFGLGFNITTHGFRKEPFKTNQKLTTLFAPTRSAFQAKYRGIFNQVFFKNDVLLNAEYVSPTLNNFFGFGNSTKYEKDSTLDYYRVRYKYVLGEVLLRKRLFDYFEVSAGPTFYHYTSDFSDNKTRILNKPSVIGYDSTSIYSAKDYLGAKVKFDINYINNELFPSRGITWYSELTALKGMNDNSHGLTKLTSDMTIYATISDESRVTTVLRAGGGKIFTSNPEYFQALSLGANNYNRGYRKNRFSGTSMAYGGTELRIKLFKSKSFILPGDVGVMGYYDVGRVWYPGERSNKWHDSYGGGFYFVPYSLVMVSATMGISPEDQLFNFTIGTKFNLTF